MELETMKKLIKNYKRQHNRLVRESNLAEQYYKKENDILRNKKRPEGKNPIRNADNRIPSNFYNILVNQKAAYLFTAPPLFDVGKDSLNKQILRILGDGYAKKCKDLCIQASNYSVAWLHYWIDEENQFQYAVVDARQIHPLWSNDLNKTLYGVLRIYDEREEDGTLYNMYEYWNEEACYLFRKKNRDTITELEPYQTFLTVQDSEVYDSSHILQHDFGEVPFIPFFNNNIGTNDLKNVKELVDCYDKVYSGFTDDLEDIQEIIFILSGYEGEKLEEFLHKLKKYKTIKVDSDNDGKGGLQTLTIDIPVEARNIMLQMTRKAIFEQGQGIDPDPQNFGNSSGVALSYLYSLLELKAGLMETEFRLGFGDLIRAICNYLNESVETINQTWTRTSVNNDCELATIAQQSVGVISNKTIVKNHPWVEDPEKEMKQLEEEQKEKEEQFNTYSSAFEETKEKEDSDIKKNNSKDGGIDGKE